MIHALRRHCGDEDVVLAAAVVALAGATYGALQSGASDLTGSTGDFIVGRAPT